MKQKGFTLLEILLVIAAIGILAAIVIVAINPNRQLAQVRRAENQSNINTIYKALEQYLVDTGQYPSGIELASQEICATGSNQVGQGSVGSDCVDLRVLVPTYIAAIPEAADSTSVETGYIVAQNVIDGSPYISAVSDETIAVNLLNEFVSDGLVVYLDAAETSSYPGSGSTWFDLSGNGQNATLNGGMAFDSANDGQFIFDGNDDFIEIPFDPIFQISPDITMEATVLYENNGYWTAVLLYPQDSSSHINPYFDWGIFLDLDERLTTRIDGDSNSTGNGVASLDGWAHYTIAVEDQNIRYYVNGTLVDTRTTSQSTITYDNNNPIYIGRNGGGAELLQGRLSNIKVYNRGLSEVEIQQNFEAIRDRYSL